jgi:hypothetical protein
MNTPSTILDNALVDATSPDRIQSERRKMKPTKARNDRLGSFSP